MRGVSKTPFNAYVPNARGGPPVYSADTKDKVRRMYDQGLSTRTIGERLGLSKNAIAGMVHRIKLADRGISIVRKPKPAPSALDLPERRLASATARLPELWISDAPASLISQTLSMTIPAVWALAEKLGLDLSLRQAPTPSRLPAIASQPMPAAPPPPAPLPQPAPSPEPVPLQAKAPPIAPRASSVPCLCSWPIGEPRTPAFRYCEAPRSPSRSYCDDHYALAYVSTPKIRA